MKLPFNIDLNNKVVVITGGAGVIGSYWVDALAECGAKVAIIDKNLELAEKKASEATARGKIALGVEANVLDKEALKKLR
jgi:NAD(P)-dependent dehydrogenase (short-subunit alcohol dehydrogenase family)